MSTTTEPRVYSICDVVRLTGLHDWTVRQEIQRTGKIAGVTPIRVGRRILIPKEAFDRVLAGQVKGDCEDVYVA